MKTVQWVTCDDAATRAEGLVGEHDRVRVQDAYGQSRQVR
jgi:hypothetical protein